LEMDEVQGVERNAGERYGRGGNRSGLFQQMLTSLVRYQDT
jgi:hypothetical protein